MPADQNALIEAVLFRAVSTKLLPCTPQGVAQLDAALRSNAQYVDLSVLRFLHADKFDNDIRALMGRPGLLINSMKPMQF